MEWKEYKRLCDEPAVMSRWALETSLRHVDDADARQAFTRILAKVPLAKPEDHQGGPETDCFEVDVGPGVARHVIEVLGRAGSSPTREERRLRHLRVVWGEYLASLMGSGGQARV